MRNYLEGSAHVVLVLSYHKNLKYLQPLTPHVPAKSIGQSTSLRSTTDLLLCRMVGYQPDALTRHEWCLSPWRE